MKDDSGKPVPRLPVYCCVFLFLLSCSGGVQVREIPINRPRPEANPEQLFQQSRPMENSGGVAANIRALCDEGSPSALFKTLVLLQENNIEESEFGRMMSAVAVTLLIKVYSEARGSLPQPDAPKNNAYNKILAEAERGIYSGPPPSSNDYLEHILPFTALLDDTAQSRFAAALPDLEKARQINPNGALAPYFMGLALERTDRKNEASELYAAALALAPDCYPAAFGIARILQEQGDDEDAVRMLVKMNNQYPGSIIIMRQLVRAYFHQNDWADARQLIDAALEVKPQDPELNLLLAQALFEERQFVQMQAVLDKYAAGNPENRDYLLLRARLQGEGFKNTDNAINILRPLYKLNPDDFSTTLYLTKLLLESNNDGEQLEGRKLLKNLMRPLNNGEEIPLDLILLASEDAVRRAAWDEARSYQDRILSERRNPSTLVNAFKVEQGAGDRRAELALAEELIQKYPNYEEGRIAYTEALIDSGRHGEAQRLIDARIGALGSGAYKSRYYYLRGLLRGSFDAAVSDFRSSLFENPRNLDALKALVELYDKRRDERHVIYYLRQALALAPKDPDLLRYQKEYAGNM